MSATALAQRLVARMLDVINAGSALLAKECCQSMLQLRRGLWTRQAKFSRRLHEMRPGCCRNALAKFIIDRQPLPRPPALDILQDLRMSRQFLELTLTGLRTSQLAVVRGNIRGSLIFSVKSRGGAREALHRCHQMTDTEWQ